MDSDEIIDLFYTIVDDDELSSTVAYTLLNLAQDTLEDERDWVVLRKRDATLTHASSDTFDTEHPLPTRFKRERKVYAEYANGHLDELHPVDYEEKEVFKNSVGHYAINYGTGKIHLLGSYSESVTIVVYYIEASIDLAEGVTCVWPEKKGAVLAYQMAQIYSGGIDGDDVNFRMSENQMKEFNAIRNSMYQWDGNLQLKAMDYQAGINPRAK